MAKILIIDDEVNMIKSIRRILEMEDYDVIEASNGADGMKVMHQNAVDLVITDIYMPEQDGIITIKEIRKHFPRVKIIAISGGDKLGSVTSLDAAEIIGAHSVFVKPLEPDELVQAVRDLLW